MSDRNRSSSVARSLKLRTRIKGVAGDVRRNRNAVPARDRNAGFKVRTGVRAGNDSLPTNHNETLVRDRAA